MICRSTIFVLVRDEKSNLSLHTQFRCCMWRICKNVFLLFIHNHFDIASTIRALCDTWERKKNISWMPQFRKYCDAKWYADQQFSLCIATKNQTCRYIRSFVVGSDKIAKTFFYFSFTITTILRPRSWHFVTHGNEKKHFVNAAIS